MVHRWSQLAENLLFDKVSLTSVDSYVPPRFLLFLKDSFQNLSSPSKHYGALDVFADWISFFGRNALTIEFGFELVFKLVRLPLELLFNDEKVTTWNNYFSLTMSRSLRPWRLKPQAREKLRLFMILHLECPTISVTINNKAIICIWSLLCVLPNPSSLVKRKI